MSVLLTDWCHPHKWTSHEGVHKKWGKLRNATTVPTCKASCAGDPECIGFNWMVSKHKCFFHGSSAAQDGLEPDPDIIHYEITRNVRKCIGKCNTHLVFDNVVA